jgi:hypothetical protein
MYSGGTASSQQIAGALNWEKIVSQPLPNVLPLLILQPLLSSRLPLPYRLKLE